MLEISIAFFCIGIGFGVGRRSRQEEINRVRAQAINHRLQVLNFRRFACIKRPECPNSLTVE